MALQSCVDHVGELPCPEPRVPGRSRCVEHERDHNRRRRRSVPTKVVEPSERTRRATAVRAHVRAHGWWCPGYGVPGHESRDLTADDVVPVAATGQPSVELAVLCRSCNGRKAARLG